MRVVLDTNVLLTSLLKTSKYRPIFDALLHPSIEVISSEQFLEELKEI